MVTKLLKLTSLIVLLTTLVGCMGEAQEDCNDYGSITRVDDLIQLTPLQTTYNVGDVIRFKVTVPAQNSYFGQEINLLEKTNDYEARLLASYVDIFTDNQLTFIKGSQGDKPNWFNVHYNSSTRMYELEIKIKLTKAKNYILQSNDYVEFQGSSTCNRWRLDTNILHNEPGPGDVVFTVQ